MVCLKRTFLLIFFVFISGNCYSNELNVVTEEYPPYNFSSKDHSTIKGISADIVFEMAKRANIKLKMTIYPWARALQMAEETNDTCLISTIRSPDRENKYKWIGPIVSDNLALFAKSDSKIVIHSLADARKYTVGTYVDSATIPILQKYKIKYEISTRDSLNPLKLKKDRMDLWVADSKTGPYFASLEGIKVKQVFLFSEAADMYMACNKNLSNEMALKFNKIFVDITNDGTQSKIQKKYLRVDPQ
jgi:polar amino acid transport system substrate-binding protein